MSIYSASSQETQRARGLLADWRAEGLITPEQYQRLEQETVSELRTTNIFLRLVLFLFTLIGVAAIAGLCFMTLLKGSSQQGLGIFLLIYGALCYWIAERVASQANCYRYGIEEALALCSVAFLCAGIELALFSSRYSPIAPQEFQFLVPAVGVVFSLWIWHRFGLWYAFPAAMIFAIFLPSYWTSSHAAQHAMIAALYAIGLICFVPLRARHRFDYLNGAYSFGEAILWLGIYLAINLQLSPMALRAQYLIGGIAPPSEFPRPFYWITWVLIWCLPPVVLARGIRQKDRFVIAVGGVSLILTFVCNKPYLGWPRHTWDPMLLGIVLVGVAVFIRRWLDRGPNGIRGGFTAARLSERDKQWMNVSSTVIGLAAPQLITPGTETTGADFRFGGGASGGGGAGGDF